jgi:hypothetical protein
MTAHSLITPAAEARVEVTDRLLRELIALARSAHIDRISAAEAELVMAALPACLEELAMHRARAVAEVADSRADNVIPLPAPLPRLINDAERRGAAIACDTLMLWGRQIERNAQGMPDEAASESAIQAHTGRFMAGCAQILRRRLTHPD